ncbi:GNAT family N-acetyltransferase [Pedococcus sp. 5OH_020]|uniref:GNAT family N-acetyltransferase n=1 Tax=Pedococcus sp. 5OH_020 TaxID=2989814 RepID=UPI0022E9BB4E|nr:GNAT family N-acetyltransferase [Pedococcus sp. 5OH_020]
MLEPEAGPRHPRGVRALTPADAAAFARFVTAVPEGERRFLKEALDASDTGWVTMLAEPASRRLVAVGPTGEIVGLAGVFRGRGWSSHVAELRVLVASGQRRRGVGRALARAALITALQWGCSHAYIEVVAEQEGLVAMFQDLGFEPEALLPDFVRDGEGRFHDLLLLTHRVDDQQGRFAVLGLQEVSA